MPRYVTTTTVSTQASGVTPSTARRAVSSMVPVGPPGAVANGAQFTLRSTFADVSTLISDILDPVAFERVDSSGADSIRFLPLGANGGDRITVMLYATAAGHRLTIQPADGVVGPTDVLSVAGARITYVWTGDQWTQESSYFPQEYYDLLVSGVGPTTAVTVAWDPALNSGAGAYPGRAAAGAGSRTVVWINHDNVPSFGPDGAQPNDCWVYSDGAGTTVVYVGDATGRWRALGRPSLFPDDQYVSALEEPSLSGFGTPLGNCGHRRIDTIDTTTTVLNDGANVKNIKYTLLITVHGTIHGTDVWFAGGRTSGSGQVSCLNAEAADVTGVYLDHCTLMPANPSGYEFGFAGHHVYAKRCMVSLCVDGIHPRNQNNPTSSSTQAENHWDGCWIGLMIFAYPAKIGTNPDGNHCDCIQAENGSGHYFTGCSIHLMLVDSTFNGDTSGQANLTYMRGQQGMLFKPSLGPMSKVALRHNWIHAASIGIKLGENVDSSGNVIYALADDTTIVENIFFRDLPTVSSPTTADYIAAMQQGDGLLYGAAGAHWVPIGLIAGQMVNGVRYGTIHDTSPRTITPAANTPMGSNVWADNGQPVPVFIDISGQHIHA